MKKSIYTLSVILGISGIILMIINPEICKNGAVYGLLLSSNVIIPSIFPFSVLTLFILNSSVLEKLKIPPVFSVFILSSIGGYPIGSKVLEQSVAFKKIDSNLASKMLNFCVNAGPAFIILAVGCGILNSKILGYVLFVSHILSSLVLMILSKPKVQNTSSNRHLNIIDNFVLSVSQSAASTISICSYVILFSVIISYVNYYSEKLIFVKFLSLFLEVTNGISQTKNIYFISFLLGFSGICVWFQVFGMAKNFKPQYIKFALFRLLQGALSSGFTYILLKIFKISVPTLSNNITANFSFTNYAPSVAVSLIIMGLIFIISLNTKNYAGNLLEDLV